MALFDAHLHPAGLSRTDLHTLAGFGVGGALLAAHAAPIDAEDALAHFRALARDQAPRLARAGIRPFLALGIAPGGGAMRDAEQVLDLLHAQAGEVRLVAVGDIGLGEGSPADEALFARQLERAAEWGLPAVIEVSREERTKRLRRTLAVLRESALNPAQVALVRARESDLSTVLGCGHAAVLSLRTGGMLPARTVAAVRRYGPGRLMLASDAGDGASDLLILPRTAHALAQAGLAPAVVRKLTRDNALALLRVDPRALEP